MAKGIDGSGGVVDHFELKEMRECLAIWVGIDEFVFWKLVEQSRPSKT